MSLPTDEERGNDRVGPHIDKLVDWLKIPYNSTQFEASNPRWADAIQTVERLQRQIEDYINREVLSKMSWSELVPLVQALCTLCFQDKFMKQVHNWDFGWLVRARPEEVQEGEDAEYELIFGWMHLNHTDGKTTLRLHSHAQFHPNAIGLLGTMLHEMVHVFIYNCRKVGELDVRTSQNDAAYSVFDKLDGQTGHGYYFLRLAREVETRFNEIFSLKSIDLGRFEAADYECQETGNLSDMAYFTQMFGDNSPGQEFAARIVWAGIKQRHRERPNPERQATVVNPDEIDLSLEDNEDATAGVERIGSSSAKRVVPRSNA
ncbi:hypothetical protein PRZ48_005269 [Zasmidium cellare]|uniref:SprT-like domain-containing protein n=1 Tax=Zasmidium cellare TaxID=395010 RepID=A0ABR0EU40_ZASCE|nr:hypothetical protein PRZ48_005269 [Zasmidium cellare]